EEIIEADTDSELESFAQSAATTPVPEQVRSDKPEAPEANAGAAAKQAPSDVTSSADLVEKLQGRAADAPICMTCGTKMRPSGSCHVCEGCGSTSGCS
ncbi:MAG TPA: hypothetical protein VK030_04075, partial [Actinomycetales bacterium]|nr:hypothetical protein [Actinomycetales bacterium]